jgi:hypothetical protein
VPLRLSPRDVARPKLNAAARYDDSSSDIYLDGVDNLLHNVELNTARKSPILQHLFGVCQRRWSMMERETGWHLSRSSLVVPSM